MEAKDSDRLKETALLVSALNLIEEQKTMVLGSTHNQTAWVAPVYYVCMRPRFYFFSSPSSRHICEMMESQTAAATIFSADDDWREIRGLQMTGEVEQVKIGACLQGVIPAYFKKFPRVREAFGLIPRAGLAQLKKRFGANLYCFQPIESYYQDNSVRFGFRREIML